MVVLGDFLRIIDLEQLLPFQGGFDHLVSVRVRDQEKLLSSFVAYRQAVPARIAVAPGLEQLAGLVVDQHVIAGLVREHDQPPLGILHHLVAIVHRVFARVQHPPAFHHPVAVGVMAQDGSFVIRKSFFYPDAGEKSTGCYCQARFFQEIALGIFFFECHGNIRY